MRFEKICYTSRTLKINRTYLMTTQTVSYTLTRWHKVVERLNAAITEAVETANKRLTQTTFNVQTKHAYSQATADAARQEGLNALQLADTLLADVARIRAAVGEANVTHRITQKLSEMDVATRQMNLFKPFLNASEGKINYETFAAIEGTSVASNSRNSLYGGSDQNQFGIAVLNAADVVHIKGKVAHYKRLAARLSDEVADANRTKVGIELSQAALEAASLSD
jgi:hypothetical protein